MSFPPRYESKKMAIAFIGFIPPIFPHRGEIDVRGGDAVAGEAALNLFRIPALSTCIKTLLQRLTAADNERHGPPPGFKK
jgi:hypothetical protein